MIKSHTTSLGTILLHLLTSYRANQEAIRVDTFTISQPLSNFYSYEINISLALTPLSHSMFWSACSSSSLSQSYCLFSNVTNSQNVWVNQRTFVHALASIENELWVTILMSLFQFFSTVWHIEFFQILNRFNKFFQQIAKQKNISFLNRQLDVW